MLALQSVPDMGLRRIKQLLHKTGTNDAADLFSLKMHDFMKIDGFGEHVARNIVTFNSWKEVDGVLEKTEKAGADLVAIDDEEYPRMLRQIYDPPILLWVKGEKSALNTDGVAIIGTRRPGNYGMQQTAVWAKRLAEAWITVNSGLAYGVDALAHKTTLQSGGKTVAVLGSGIDVIYPAKNSKLAHQMIENGGAVITEYPPGTPPDAVNFPARNRIVSGMSHGVLVVESGIKGGSMITARYALDQNREVFVVPHYLDYARGEGCNYLIKTGQGKLVQKIEDILEEVSITTNTIQNQKNLQTARKWESLELKSELKTICKLLTEGVLHIDQISEKLESPTFKLLPLLLDLEMQGAIRQKAGKYFELV
ncbi:MAG: DNA-protecting protein DprA [Balneolaceae bacterium]|nr:MAG: DNA-protecting protein DprA [Balneolaceae bacterium]